MSDLAPARTLPILWGAIGAGGVLAAVALAVVGQTSPPPLPAYADAAFYALALASVVATGAAFAVLRRMETRLPDVPDANARLARFRTDGVVALALAEMPAIGAGVAAFLTGNVLALAFVVPFVAFVALTWPSDARQARWLSLRER